MKGETKRLLFYLFLGAARRTTGCIYVTSLFPFFFFFFFSLYQCNMSTGVGGGFLFSHGAGRWGGRESRYIVFPRARGAGA